MLTLKLLLKYFNSILNTCNKIQFYKLSTKCQINLDYNQDEKYIKTVWKREFKIYRQFIMYDKYIYYK